MFSALMQQMMAVSNNTTERVVQAVNTIKHSQIQKSSVQKPDHTITEADSSFSDIEVDSDSQDEDEQADFSNPPTTASAPEYRVEAIEGLCFETATTEAEPPCPDGISGQGSKRHQMPAPGLRYVEQSALQRSRKNPSRNAGIHRFKK